MTFKLNLPLKIALAAFSIGILGGCSGGGEAKTTEGTTPAPSAPTEGGTTATRPLPSVPGNTAGDKIVIGIVASENGDLRPWGVDSVAGAKLAVKEANAAGGINGKQIELKVGDSNSNAEQGKSAAEKLISEGSIVLLGEVASGITMQMGQAAFEKGVPVIAIGATKTDLGDKMGNIFRVCYTDALQGPVMAKFAYEELALRKIGIITDKSQPYSTGLSDSFRAYFVKLGGEIVDEQFYEAKQTQFSGQLTNLKSKNPDGLFMSGYFNETGPIARQAHDIGLKVPMLGGDGWDSSEILNTGGDAILGSFFCNHYNNQESRPEVADFLKKWAAEYPSNAVPATTMGALGYDAAKLAIDALGRSKSLSSKDLITALEETTDFLGVSGKVLLKGQNGNPPKRALVVELTKAGQVFRKAYEADQIK